MVVPFSLAVRFESTTLIVELGGEIDLAIRDRLVDAVTEHLAKADAVVVDLAAATFMDSSAISALVQINTETTKRGKAFGIRAAAGNVEHVLRMTGLDTWFRDTTSW